VKIVGDWAWERAVNWGLTRDDLEEFQARRQGSRAELLKFLRSRVLGKAVLVIVPSHYLGEAVQRWGVEPARMVCVYNASDGPGARGACSLPEFQGATLCTVARLVPWKGLGLLIRLIGDLPHTRLVIIGEGPLRSSLERQAREMGVASRVFFMGRLAPSEVAGCLAAADLFVLNSTYEGLPHVVLEAFAAGVPVVATAVGGVPEVVQHGQNGWLVTPGQDTALREAVQRLISDIPLRRKLIEGGQRTLVEKFAWPRLVSETEEALMRALHARGLARG
jgi:glycosyltransferase involved in cell wall biosynthesis